MQLTDEQIAAVESNYKVSAVIAAPGSGKSSVITERAKFLLNHGVKPEELFLVTYTNNAAQEMRNRLSSCEGFDKVFIGTIHGLAAQILSINNVQVGYILEQAEKTDNFDLLFDDVKRRQDKLYIPNIKHFLIDEFQDICPNEYYFIVNVLKPENMFFVGDPRQEIYSFKGASPKFFLDICNDPNTGLFELTNNFRNKANIIQIANQVISPVPDLPEIEMFPVRDGLAKITTIPFDLEYICDYLNGRKDYKDWFVLVRSNKLLKEVADAFKYYGVPFETFRQADKTKEEMDKIMASDVVKLLTIHSAKGLESKNVILFQNPLWGRTQEDRDEERRIRYVGITRAKDNLILVKQPSKKKKQPNPQLNALFWG